MKKYFDTVITSAGQPAIGVSVQVNNYPSLTAATIYSDNGVTPKTNPITTDATGYFEFYVADGRYQITISGTGIVTRQINDVVIEDYADMTGPLTITGNSSSPALKITQTGTGNALVVEDVASDSTPFVIDQSGNVGVGVSTAFANNKLSVAGGTDASTWLVRSSADVTGYEVRLLKNRNTNVYANTVVNASDVLGAVSFGGNDGTNYQLGASIQALVDGTPGPSDMPGRLVFSTTGDGGSTPVERMRIDSSGNVLVKSAAGLGYGTGAGGQVTQVTSKSTAVTLNTPSGQITMNNAALAAGASVSFTFNNSLISASDVVLLTPCGGFSVSGNYSIRVGNTQTGAISVFVKNESAGSLSEAVIINFCVIKGVIA